MWLTAAFLAWAALALFLGLGLVRSWARLRRLLADRRAIESGPATTMLARLSAGSSVRRIRLSASSRVDVPIAVGVLRPEIVVPERALVELESAELESMLAHELAHLVRRDPAWRLLAGFVHRVLFLQPLNRIATAHLESASEDLCDDWAVERTDRPLALARCLTEVAGWVASPLGASVPAMARRGSGLGRRVRRLVAAGDGFAPRRRDRWPIPLAAGGLALVVFAAPGATDTYSMSPPAPMTPAPILVSASAEDVKAERAPRPSSAPSSQTQEAQERKQAQEPQTADREDARRLLDQLRAGKKGRHDLSDWLALAQLLGSPDKGGVGGMLHSAAGGDPLVVSAGGVPLVSSEDIEDLVEGALSQAFAGSLGIDFDIDVDAEGGINIHIDGIDINHGRHHDHDGDGDSDDGGFDFDFDLGLGVPDVDVDVDVDIPIPPVPPVPPVPPMAPMAPLPPEPPDPPDPPDPPEPPDPPDVNCDGHSHHDDAYQDDDDDDDDDDDADDEDDADDDDDDSDDDASSAAREIRRQALAAARIAREQARVARQQAEQVRRQALQQAHQARTQALQQAQQARAQALQQAHQARNEALRQAHQARDHARRAQQQVREQMRQAERAMRDSQRQEQERYEKMLRRLEERRREIERERERERQQL